MTAERSPQLASWSDDVEALRRVAGGDLAALGEVYDRHARVLLAFVCRTAGRDDAEDVVQDVFVRAARLAASYDARIAPVRAWLLGIAARLIQERRRWFARTRRMLLRFGAGERRLVQPPAVRRSDIEVGLRQLSPAKRIVIVLADVEELSCAEIAALLEIPIGTVWTRLHHARRHLREFYGPEGQE